MGYAQADQVYAKILGPSKHALKLVLVLNTLNKGIGKTSENDVWNMLLVELAAVTWNLAAAQKWHSCQHDCMIANIQHKRENDVWNMLLPNLAAVKMLPGSERMMYELKHITGSWQLLRC